MPIPLVNNTKPSREMVEQERKFQIESVLTLFRSRLWIQQHAKICPHCQAAIEKNGGISQEGFWAASIQDFLFVLCPPRN
jgi:hypothetical protein